MKNSKFYVVLIIWAAALAQLFVNSGFSREEDMVEQVFAEQSEGVNIGKVKAYSFYSKGQMEEVARENIAVNIADKLGITSGYTIEKKDSKTISSIILKKEGEDADTLIKVIQTKTEDKYGQQETGNYVLTEITLKNTASKQVNAFKKELENMYGDLGMSTNVNEYIRSQKKGMLSDDEMDEIVEEFLKEMNAKKVSEGEVNGAKCIYGYSKSVDSYVFENEDKVNVNIAFSYNEEEDVTYIHRAVPFIDKSF